ncbi:MAG: histidine phosphatase family protein [Chitinophagaceae bacterium]
MKTLILIRHAKSSWELTSVEDFDRPLNDRGKHDAPEMAKRLLKKGIKIDAFISSPAKRAKKTAQLFSKEFRSNKDDIIYLPELYAARVDVFSRVVKSIDNAYHTIALFSHNPGITEFVNTLTHIHIDNVPTCGVFGVKVLIDSWSDFEEAKKEYWFFDYPKMKD